MSAYDRVKIFHALFGKLVKIELTRLGHVAHISPSGVYPTSPGIGILAVPLMSVFHGLANGLRRWIVSLMTSVRPLPDLVTAPLHGFTAFVTAVAKKL